MDYLPRIEIPGLLRLEGIVLRHEVAAPLLPLGAEAEVRFHGTASGRVALHLEGRSEVTLWDPRTDYLETRDLQAAAAGWQGLDATHEAFAVAGGPSLRLLSDSGDLRRQHLFATAGSAHCRFAVGGALWHLIDTASGWATLRLLDASGEVLDTVQLTHASSDLPAYWLDEPHPAQRLIPISAGMGQDGAFYIMASERNGLLAVEEAVDGLCFAGWSPSGEVFATLPHNGEVLRVCTLDGTLCWERDLGPLFEALEDYHNYRVQLLDADRVLLPSAEGRLFVIGRGQPEVNELRLIGDERNWDWAHVQLGPDDSLITARRGDRTIRVWDLSSVLS